MSKSFSKMAPPKTLLILFLSILLLFTVSFATQNDDDLDDDIAFLESQETKDVPSSQSNDNHEGHEDSGYDQEPYSPPNIDEKDVVVLKKENFSEFIEKNKYVLVEFYAPWCGHCQALAPEYAEAATELKGEVALAKVDATQEGELAQEYGIEGLPTMFFFVDGVHEACEGQRTKEAIVTWVKKKTGPSIHNITTTEEAEHILTSESKIVLAFLDSLVGPESEELAAASRLEDDINFYQTSNPDVAKIFNIEPKAKRPALVLLKKEDEKLSYFDGQFFKLGITQFVSTSKLPLVIHFTRESSSLVFENPIKRQLFLFATSNDSEKIIPTFKEAAKDFKGKLIFVYIEMDNKDHGKSFSDYFGVSGDEPRVLGFTGFSDARKFFFDGELTLSNIKSFVEDFLEDKLTPFYKSDPIPETNNGDVKIVVGKSFDEIVLDESKDVLLEIYAPWCWHCQALEPIYNKLGMYLRGIDSLVIAKMDGTTNEHSRAKADGFPTFLFFPAGNKKSLDPIIVETDRTVVEFYKFLKKHASFPFKLQKPTSTEQPKVVEATKSHESKSENVKDEL